MCPLDPIHHCRGFLCPEDEEAGPLNYSPLAAMVHADGVGRMFDSARGYRERVGRLLFGLPLDEYDELLLLLDRLANLRWAEQIAPRRLAEQLVIAPPQTFVDHRSGRETRAGWRAAGRVACTP